MTDRELTDEEKEKLEELKDNFTLLAEHMKNLNRTVAEFAGYLLAADPKKTLQVLETMESRDLIDDDSLDAFECWKTLVKESCVMLDSCERISNRMMLSVVAKKATSRFDLSEEVPEDRVIN